MADDDFDITDWIRFSPVPPSPVQTPSETVILDSREARRQAGNDRLAQSGSIGASTTPGVVLEKLIPNDGTSDSTSDSTLTSDLTLTYDDILTRRKPRCPAGVRHAAAAPSSLRVLKPKALQSRDKSTEGQVVKFLHSNQSTGGRLPKESRKRRRLNLEGDSYRETRDAGACARCWMRRVKCGSSNPCERCDKDKVSIPSYLCCRTRVKDLLNHRPGLAHKFIECFQGYIVCWDGAEEKKDIKLWHGLHSSFSVKVTQFTSRHDIVDLWWKNPTGWMKTRHTPFGICGPVDVDIKWENLDEYIYAQIPFILDQVQAKHQDHGRFTGQSVPKVSPSPKGSDLWLRIMRSICNHVEGDFEGREILRCALLLWAYTFLIYHALWQFTADENHNKLGMAQLALDNHDCETLTNFSDATPLPRLLLLQIHACMEARMQVLEKSLVSALHHAYISLYKSAGAPDWMTAYFATWVYLSILEEIAWDAGRWNNLREVILLRIFYIRLRELISSEQFDWPLPDRSPDSNYDLAEHSAHTVLAHYQTAVKNKKVAHLYEHLSDHGAPQEPRKDKLPADLRTDRNLSMEPLFQELSSFAASETSELDRKIHSTFCAEDIRSLEMKFAATMIS